MSYPATFRYTKEHEWIEVDGKTGKIGITDYAQQSLGDIVFVDLPKIGAKVEQGKTFGSVESVKAVSDLFAPVSGTITEVNEDLASSPEKLNNGPHEAWIMKVELSDPSEVEKLLYAADYEKYVAEEAH
jgi:glycine cleavage system H protein